MTPKFLWKTYQISNTLDAKIQFSQTITFFAIIYVILISKITTFAGINFYEWSIKIWFREITKNEGNEYREIIRYKII